ncbi:MAG TPA: hypothetical protein VET23_04660 [Chitinophagaceae bacterium]|nr:hypothetical protein [Chitinophagaceae bacterium]
MHATIWHNVSITWMNLKIYIMKKIFTLSVVVLCVAFIFNSCIKNVNPGISESYWLSKESGDVVYADSYCNYYVVETSNGYTIIRIYDGYKPYQGNIVYGDFSSYGTHDIYNRSAGIVYTGTVTDYWLTYTEAQDALNYYCPLAGKNLTREFLKKK